MKSKVQINNAIQRKNQEHFRNTSVLNNLIGNKIVPNCKFKKLFIPLQGGANHGLMTPNEAFFHRNIKGLGLGILVL